jgi:Domain of unknown function (DUF4272)
LTEPAEDQEEAPDQIRAPRDDVTAWLKETGAWDNLSPTELALLEASSPTRQMMIDAGWRSEALTMLLWTLGKLGELPPADVECDTSIFQEILPPFADISAEEFVKTATRRSDTELLDMAEACMNLHAEYYSAERQGRPPRQPVDGGIIRERHHAINWAIGYEGLAWDHVTTDT